MTTSINTNVSAYFAQNNLRSSSAQAQSSIARLSSGNKIIRASDDVAALSIGTVLRTDVSTLKTALSNTSQAGSLIQVADGALQRLGEILQRQKALATQGNADTLSNTERGYLNQEFQALRSEYDRIATETNFNGIALLNGNLSGTSVASGAASTGTVATSNITITPANTNTITAISVNSLGASATTGGQNLDALFTADNIATLTVAATPSALVAGDFSLGRSVSTFAASNLNTAAKLDATTKFLDGLSVATVSFTGNVANDGTGTISIVSGGQTFTSATADFKGNPGAVTLTHSGSGATFTLDLNRLPGTVTNTATLQASAAAVQAELRTGAYATSAVAGDFTLGATDANITTISVASLGTTAKAGVTEVASFLGGISTATVSTTASPLIAGDITVGAATVPARSLNNYNISFSSATPIASLTAASLGSDNGVNLNTFGAGLATATVLFEAGPVTPPLAAAYTVSETSGDISAFSVTFAGNTDGDRTTFRTQFTDANLAAATVTISDGGTAGDSLGTLTVNIGTLSFASSADAFQTNTNPAAIVLTDATTGAQITVDFNALGQAVAEAGTAQTAVQAAIRTATVVDSTNDAVGDITITSGGIEYTATGVTLSGNPGAITLTETGGNGSTLSLDLAALGITDGASLEAADSAVQTALRTGVYAAPANVLSSVSISNVGSDAAALATAFTQLNIASATVSSSGTLTNNTSTGTVTITIGGMAFSAAQGAINVTSANSAVDFTSSTGAVLTLSLADLNRTSLHSGDTEGARALATIQESVRALTVTNAGNNGQGRIAITSGGVTYQSSATANFADGQGAVTFTSTGVNASTLSINLANLGITNDSQLSGAAATIQTAVRTITASAVPNETDFSVTPVVSSMSVTAFGSNAVAGRAAVSAFVTANDTLFATFTGAGANDGTGQLTLTAGGVTFASGAAVDFTNNPAAVTLTDAVTGATISLDLSNLNLVSNNSAGLVAATTSVQEALRNLDARNFGEDGIGQLAITIGSTIFTSPAASSFADAQGAVLFTSDSANGEILSINMADLGIDTDAELTSGAAALQLALRGTTYANSFNFTATEGKTGAAAFQVGTESDDTISISISDVRTTNAYRNNAGIATVLSIGTKADAITASAVLDNAINTLTSVRAQVGAAQSRFNFAAATLETSVQNLDSARAGFLDADISNESTAFASQQVLIQASISVLAQANQLPQNLLKLIG